MPSSLEDAITALILAEGPIGVDRYMSLAMGHPALGYYRTRDPFGPSGDFVTAPEISQMFGELLGLWAALIWRSMGSPAAVRLVELGPGRGTLMADALRAARTIPSFLAALAIDLVETSPVLREAQRRALQGTRVSVSWHEDIGTLPDGPAIVLANEFLDALPVRHYVNTPRGWCERVVGLREGRLSFGLAPEPDATLTVAGPPGAILELGLASRSIVSALASRIVREGGAALIVDYGYAVPSFGETLQAVRAHRFVDPLEAPGEADLTAHVNFAAVAQAARAAGAAVYGPVPQGAFLHRLGLAGRLDALKRRADARQAAALDRAAARLAGPGTPDQPGMGELFKVLALTQAGLTVPPGFDPDPAP